MSTVVAGQSLLMRGILTALLAESTHLVASCCSSRATLSYRAKLIREVTAGYTNARDRITDRILRTRLPIIVPRGLAIIGSRSFLRGADVHHDEFLLRQLLRLGAG